MRVDTAMGRRAEAIFKRESDEGAAAKISSYRAKFMSFIAAEHCSQMPLLPMFPVSLDTIMVFAAWCSENGINGGMDSIKNYIGEVVRWGIQVTDQRDPRANGSKARADWRVYERNFRFMVKTTRKLKLRIQPAMFQAIMSMIDVNDWRDMRDGAQYAINMYSAARIGHTAAASSAKPKHLLRFKDLVFDPSIEKPERVFIYLRSTKTRFEAEGKPTWQSVGAVHPPNGDMRLCPVYMLQRWVTTQYAGDPNAALFAAAKANRRHLPCGRTEFADTLRARIVLALPRLDVNIEEFDIEKYSAIGFRKGSLSALAHSRGITAPRLAAHGDHTSVDTTLHYLSDSVESRAGNSSAIASHFTFPDGGNS